MKRRSLLKFLGLVPVMGASALSASKVEAKEFELPKMTNYGIDNIKEINLKELRRRVDQLYDKLMPETTYRPDPGFKAQLAKTIMRDICFPAKHDRIQHIRLVIDESDYNGRSALFQTVPLSSSS